MSDMEMESDGGEWASGSEEAISEEEFKPAGLELQKSYLVRLCPYSLLLLLRSCFVWLFRRSIHRAFSLLLGLVLVAGTVELVVGV
jgi:hypothetical protein